jgi:hypothetical protein
VSAKIPSWKKLQPILAPVLTGVIFLLIFRKVPFGEFKQALLGADYLHLLSALVPFSVLYFILDTVVLQFVVRWFHGKVSFKELLPVRATDYIISILNHKLSQGAIVVYLGRKLRAPLLEIASSILFLDLLQKTHLVFWATLGMLLLGDRSLGILFTVPIAVALGWSVFLLYVRGRLTILGRYAKPPSWQLLRTFRMAPVRRYVEVLLLKAPLLVASAVVHTWAIQSFGIEIPFGRLLATLPIIFLVGALPVTVAHLGTTQAAWIYFYGNAAESSALLAYSLAAHLTFMLGNAALGLVFLPRAYRELTEDVDLGATEAGVVRS